jgi:hypothetical protein
MIRREDTELWDIAYLASEKSVSVLQRIISRPKPILLLNAAAHMSHGSLRQWLQQHHEVDSLTVFGHGPAPLLDASALPGSNVQAVKKTIQPEIRRVTWQRLFFTIGTYDTIIVLCAGDDEVTAGYAPFRLLGEMLFSRRLILVGPTKIMDWPNGRGLIHPSRLREVLALVAAGILGLAAASLTMLAVSLSDLVNRVRMA